MPDQVVRHVVAQREHARQELLERQPRELVERQPEQHRQTAVATLDRAVRRHGAQSRPGAAGRRRIALVRAPLVHGRNIGRPAVKM